MSAAVLPFRTARRRRPDRIIVVSPSTVYTVEQYSHDGGGEIAGPFARREDAVAAAYALADEWNSEVVVE